MLFFCFLVWTFCGIKLYSSSLKKKICFDVIGQTVYRELNYKSTGKYQDVDGWILFKSSYWLDENKTFGCFISVIPSFSSHIHDSFQNNLEGRLGLQLYIASLPILKEVLQEKRIYKTLRSLRLFVDYGSKDYLDSEDEERLSSKNRRIGIDYYNDNLETEDSFYHSIYAILLSQTTGYTIENPNEEEKILQTENATSVAGDFDWGLKIPCQKMNLIPYVTTQFQYGIEGDERWWGNFLRLGVGIKVFPFYQSKKMNRFSFFCEYVNQVAVFQGKESMETEDHDIRIGIEFSTTGFFRKLEEGCDFCVEVE